MKPKRIPHIILLTLAVCFMACEKGPELAEKYQAVSNERGGTIVLELKTDGSGVWMFEGDEAFFKWEAKDGNVWLHTKDGGVIIGHVERNAIRIALPGLGEFVFKPN